MMEPMRHNLKMILAILLFGQMAFGQTRDAFIRAAEASFDTKDYFSAMSYYSEALEFQRDIPTVHAAAESARLFDAYSIATDYYKEVLEGSDNEYPNVSFYLGQMLQRQGIYDTAITYYQVYISETDDTDSTFVRIASAVWAMSTMTAKK